MFKVWLTSWRRGAHRRAVRAHVRFLLAGLPIADRRWVMGRFAHDAWPAVDGGFGQGDENEYETAVGFTAYLLTTVIEKVMTVEERELIRGQLDAWRGRSDGGRLEAVSHPWARGLALLEHQTSVMIAEKKIRPYMQRFLLTEVAGALAGTPQEERRQARMSVAAEELRAERRQAAREN